MDYFPGSSSSKGHCIFVPNWQIFRGMPTPNIMANGETTAELFDLKISTLSLLMKGGIDGNIWSWNCNAEGLLIKFSSTLGVNSLLNPCKWGNSDFSITENWAWVAASWVQDS